jgi:hypothetical protein
MMTLTLRKVAWMVLLAGAAACGRNEAASDATSTTPRPATAPPAAATSQSSGPIDVCAVVTPAEAAAILGSLPPQPPSKTDNAGFGTYMCMYVGPALSGEGAQTHFARLTVSAGRGKDATELMHMDVEKRHATVDLPGVADAAKRSENGWFVWAKQGATSCIAEISVGLPPGLTGDSAASQLGRLCGKIFAQAGH